MSREVGDASSLYINKTGIAVVQRHQKFWELKPPSGTETGMHDDLFIKSSLIIEKQIQNSIGPSGKLYGNIQFIFSIGSFWLYNSFYSVSTNWTLEPMS